MAREIQRQNKRWREPKPEYWGWKGEKGLY